MDEDTKPPDVFYASPFGFDEVQNTLSVLVQQRYALGEEKAYEIERKGWFGLGGAVIKIFNSKLAISFREIITLKGWKVWPAE